MGVKHLWGISRTLYVDDQVQLDICHGIAGGASSMHKHDRKHNAFFVTGGSVAIFGENPAGGEEIRLAVLGPNQSCHVEAGRKHRMVFLADSDLFEVYTAATYSAVDMEDIVRFDEGRSPSMTRNSGNETT